MRRVLIGAVMIPAMAVGVAAQDSQSEILVLSPGVAVLAPRQFRSLTPGSFETACGRPTGSAADNKFGYWGYACDPFYAGNYGIEESPPIVIGQAVAPRQPAPQAPPPATIRAEMRAYEWPPSRGDSRTTFSIVSKNGQVQPAAMVWVQGDSLCYVTPAGGAGRMPIDAIDRQATLHRNAGRYLWLPPEG